MARTTHWLNRVGLVVFILLVLTPISSRCQTDEPVRRGFWLSAGAEAFLLGCSTCGAHTFVPRPDLGEGGYGAFGWTLNPQVLLGLQSDFWARDENPEQVVLFSAVAQVYPSQRSRLHLKTGAGRGIYTPPASRAHGYGWGGMAGVGYDLRVHQAWHVAPYLHFVRLSVQGESPRTLQFGVATSWY